MDTLTDAKGRTLALRKLTVLDQVKLLRAIGPEQSTNEPYVNLVNAAASVARIDGVPQPMPVNERQIDGMIGRLGDEGIAAVAINIQAQIAAVMAAAEAAREGADGNAAKPDPLPPPA